MSPRRSDSQILMLESDHLTTWPGPSDGQMVTWSISTDLTLAPAEVR